MTEQDSVYSTPQSQLHDTGKQSSSLRRDGQLLVLDRNDTLPVRCIHCNEAAPRTYSSTVFYISPKWYLLYLLPVVVIFNPYWSILSIPLLVLTLLITAWKTHRQKLDIPLCKTHIHRIRYLRLGAVSSFLSSLAIMIYLPVLNLLGSRYGIPAGVIVMLIAFAMASRSRAVKATKIDKVQIRLKGCKEAFLSTLMEQRQK